MSKINSVEFKDTSPVHIQCCKYMLSLAIWVGLVLCSLLLLHNASHTLPTNINKDTGGKFLPKVKNKDQEPLPVSVAIHTKDVLHTVDERFASIAIDSSLIREKFKHFDTSSVKLKILASALNPCFVRVGGTAEDLLIFDNEEKKNKNEVPSHLIDKKHTDKNFTMTVEDFDRLNQFVSAVGWDLVFGLNILLRNGNSWDESNALTLMRYSDSKAYPLHLELGNEPNSFRHVFGRSVDPNQSARDFGKLRQLMRTLPSFEKKLLIGPDVTELYKNKSVDENLGESSKDYLKAFLETGKDSVDVVSFHHYYVRAQTTSLKQFIDPDVLDRLLKDIDIAHDILNSTGANEKRLWLGEAGSASGGGAKGLSDRYVAGFMWLDRLGLSARRGVDVVIRQSFYNGAYAMIDKKDYTPFPDYWLTLLYKKLVGTKVLEVQNQIKKSTSNHIRLYAHCTRTDKQSPYQPGAITLYVLNLYESSLKLNIPQFHESYLHLYMLTPGRDGDLTSSTVRLNGKELMMLNQSALPFLYPTNQQGSVPVEVQPLSFGFIVIPKANATVCR